MRLSALQSHALRCDALRRDDRIRTDQREARSPPSLLAAGHDARSVPGKLVPLPLSWLLVTMPAVSQGRRQQQQPWPSPGPQNRPLQRSASTRPPPPQPRPAHLSSALHAPFNSMGTKLGDLSPAPCSLTALPTCHGLDIGAATTGDHSVLWGSKVMSAACGTGSRLGRPLCNGYGVEIGATTHAN